MNILLIVPIYYIYIECLHNIVFLIFINIKRYRNFSKTIISLDFTQQNTFNRTYLS